LYQAQNGLSLPVKQGALVAKSFDDIPEQALKWHTAGAGAALATVVETWGSAPRPVGAQMAVSGMGEVAGSVSGGCVEGAVVLEAVEAIEDGKPRLLEFGVSDDDAFAVGLACGGRIRVMVEPVCAALEPGLLNELVAARKARRPAIYVVNTESWERQLADINEYSDRLVADRSGFAEDGTTFVNVHNTPLRLAIVGAGHIAQPLSQMARLTGYDVTIIDPREAFASSERFPGFLLSNDWPDKALAALGLDARTAVVTLAHDPKIDDPAVLATLNSGAFYLGCLGSRRTHQKRLERLSALGLSQAELARIHGPVGLKIAGKSPAEIAISILAEITQVLRSR
jgi:xanthine dehydrogenase accessory factor